MVLTALRGALGFLTRIPVGHDKRAWDTFSRSPVAFPIVGYVIGVIVLLSLALPAPEATVAFLFVLWLYIVTGINHLDGLADFGDAVVVHGDDAKRRSVLKDTTLGVGGVLALSIVVFGLGSAGFALATAPRTVVFLIVTAEVSAKLGMATISCLGVATHDGLGSTLTERTSPRSLGIPAFVALPAAVLTWPHPAAAVTLVAGVAAAASVLWWSNRQLGGVNGDVFGASNEIARVVALHAGVMTWTLF